MTPFERETKLSEIDALRHWQSAQATEAEAEAVFNDAEAKHLNVCKQLADVEEESEAAHNTRDAFPPEASAFRKIPYEPDACREHRRIVEAGERGGSSRPSTSQIDHAKAAIAEYEQKIKDDTAYNEALRNKWPERVLACDRINAAAKKKRELGDLLGSLKRRLDDATNKHNKRRDETTQAKLAVAEGLQELDPVLVDALLAIKLDGKVLSIKGGWNGEPRNSSIPNISASQRCSIARGEVPAFAFGNENEQDFRWTEVDGYGRVGLTHPELPASFTLLNEHFETSWVTKRPTFGQDFNDLVPKSHRSLSRHLLQPWSVSPTPIDVQAKQIAMLKALPDTLRGLVMLGPPGTSKTAFAATFAKDLYTERAIMRDGQDFPLCMWRVKANKWLAENHAWECRAFDDSNVPYPSLSIEQIERECKDTGLTPVLWIEEIDKIRSTTYQKNLLDSLIDSVYELKGLVIITCNATKSELADYISPAAMRRVLGTADDPNDFKFWDFYRSRRTKA